MDPVTEKILMTIPTALIAFGGILSNTLSLSYFIRRENATLWSRLFILLNSLDLAVCMTGSVSVILTFWFSDHYMAFIVTAMLLFVFLEGTAFATCVLSVGRMLSLCKPFYQIDGKAIAIATVCFFVYVMVVPTTFLYLDAFYSFGNIRSRMFEMSCTLSVIIVVVVTCNVYSINKLMRCRPELGQDQISEINRKATVTVFILSVLFCFFNLIFAAVVGCGSFHDCIPNDNVKYFVRLLIIPLNSALNPVVYFIRKQKMRVYVKQVVCWSEVEESGVVQVVNRSAVVGDVGERMNWSNGKEEGIENGVAVNRSAVVGDVGERIDWNYQETSS